MWRTHTSTVQTRHSETRELRAVTTRTDALLFQLSADNWILLQACKHLLMSRHTCPRCWEALHMLESLAARSLHPASPSTTPNFHCQLSQCFQTNRFHWQDAYRNALAEMQQHQQQLTYNGQYSRTTCVSQYHPRFCCNKRWQEVTTRTL